MNKAEELKQNYIRYHKTAAGKHKGVSLEFANEIEMNSFLQLYADEQSRKAFNDARERIGFEMIQQKYLDFEDWKSNQEGE